MCFCATHGTSERTGGRIHKNMHMITLSERINKYEGCTNQEEQELYWHVANQSLYV